MHFIFTNTSLLPFLLALVPALINAGLGAYVFFKFPRRRITDVFSIVLLASACWQLSAALMRISASEETALLADNILSPIGLLTAPLILDFTLRFSGLKRENVQRTLVGTAYIVTIFLVALYPSLNTSASYVHDPYWGWMNMRGSGIYPAVLGLALQLQYLLALVVLLTTLFHLRKGSERYYQQLLITVPFGFVVLLAMATETIIPIVFKRPPIPLSPSTMSLFTVSTFIALKRYNLFQGIKSIRKEELLDNTSDIVIVADASLRITYMNRSGLAFLGYQLAQLEGRPLSEFMHCASVQIEKLLAESPAPAFKNYDCQLRSGDGRLISVLVSAKVIKHAGKWEGLLLTCRNITDIEEARGELEKIDRRFKKILDRSKDSVALFDSNGVITYVTPSVKNVLGYEPDDLLGKKFQTFIHPDFVEQASARFWDISNETQYIPQESVYKVFGRDGREIWLEAIALNQLGDEDIHAVICVFRDVTEKYNILKELANSLAIFESLVHDDNDAILMEDAERKVFAVNDMYCSFFSIPDSVENLKGKDSLKILQRTKELMADPDGFMQRIQEIINGSQVVNGEAVYFANGRVCERDYYPIASSSGELLCHYWRYTDVTQEKNTQKELIDKNRYLELSMEIGQMGSWWAELEQGGRAYWSKEALEIYGMSEEEFDGRAQTYFDFVHPDDVEAVYQGGGQAMAEHRPFSLEHRIILRDGTMKWVYNRMYTEYDGDKPVRLVGIVQDITKRKHAEEEILSQNQELIKINAELDSLVYSASHDIRSPLMSILGLTNVAQDEMEDPSAKSYFKMIEDRVKRLDEFTLDIIHYRRNAKTELQKEQVPLQEFVNSVLESLKYQEEAEGISFEMAVSPDVSICTDRSRLFIVLSNLVSNAIKYHNPKAERPFVRIQALAMEDKVEIIVSDNGEGIPPNKLERIFDMFSRFSQHSSGSGLGLYIVKEIMNKLGGTIEVESALNEGSTFKVLLPVDIEKQS